MSIWRKLAGFEDVNKNDKPKIEKVKKRVLMSDVNESAKFQEEIRKDDEQPKAKQAENQPKKEPQKIEGFNGWLVLFGLGIFVTPIFIFFSMITEPEAYDGLGIFFNILIIIGYIWLNYLMVKRRKVFKKWFLGIGIAQIVLTGLIAISANSESYLYSQSELSDINTSAFRTLFYIVVWSLYLWNSKRVKNTFIN